MRQWYYRDRVVEAPDPGPGKAWQAQVQGCKTAEDYPTIILLGRWFHAKNLITGNWFVVQNEHPTDPKLLEREGCRVTPISYYAAKKLGGRRVSLAVLEDWLGIRIPQLCRKLTRFKLGWLPFVGRGRRMDEQDWSRWHEFEQPRIVKT